MNLKQRRRAIGAFVAGSALVVAVAAQRPAVEPGAGPAACAGCHAAQVEAWTGSRHAVASSNPTFAASFRNSQHAWCLQCHAASGGAGVGCAACHLDGGRLVGTSPSWRARLAHPIGHDEDLVGAAACATCHQFDFPRPSSLEAAYDVPPAVFTDTPTQDTVAEWRHSAAAAAGTACTGCHDPHAAPGAHDAALLRGAIRADVALEGDHVRAVITAVDAAHAVPTGDPYRRLRLTICPPERCEVPLARHDLERRFDRRGDDWVELSDTRIGPATDGDAASVVVELSLPPGPLAPGTRWRLFYHYADPRHEPDLPPSEVRTLVAEGVLVAGEQEPT